ncbi:MAG: ATP-binding cassette domain-containing protein [Myxococcota bacterium]|nr:ATP-binding cassette domain-containing protein [Myxococcota bacterium]
MASEDELRIQIEGVTLARGDRKVFDGLCCGIPRAGITVVLGGSGAGKSTLLRLMGGLLRPDSGRVRVAGRDVPTLGTRELFALREKIGMLFQGGALLDSMTIFDNVALPLREHTRLPEAAVAEEVSRRLEAVGLPDTGALYPRELSGGMGRRAALARAVVNDPEILLCDEPFSGLDPVNVRRIEALLIELNQRLGLTMVVTSHHLESTLRMADRIIFLTGGRAVSGTPEQLLRSEEPEIVEFLVAEGRREAVEPSLAEGA